MTSCCGLISGQCLSFHLKDVTSIMLTLITDSAISNPILRIELWKKIHEMPISLSLITLLVLPLPFPSNLIITIFIFVLRKLILDIKDITRFGSFFSNLWFLSCKFLLHHCDSSPLLKLKCLMCSSLILFSSVGGKDILLSFLWDHP